MIRSMTGFARAIRGGEWGELRLEIRAVNHRYLDLKFVLPEALYPLEANLREQLQARLARGRIEVAVRWRASDSSGMIVNRALVLRLAHEARQLQGEVGERGTGAVLDALRLLAWPGVIETAAPQLEALRAELLALGNTVLDELIAVREREGRALSALLEERLARLEAGIEACGACAGEVKRTLPERLAERIAAFGREVDPARVAQEAALLLVRQDVSEELERLAVHAGEVRRLLGADDAAGRRLDFLMQELMREANTLGAKAGDVAINRHALDFKVLIEEMREQVQNVE